METAIKREIGNAVGSLKMIFTVGLMALLLLPPVQAPAQERDSPFALRPLEDIVVLGTGMLTAAGVYFLHAPPAGLSPQDIEQLHRSSISYFDRGASYNWSPVANQLSEAASLLSISAMIPLLFNENARSDAVVLSVMSAQMLTWAVTLPQVTKISALRKRPYVYNPQVSLEEKTGSRAMESFFSRTTTVAFASSIFSSLLFEAYFPHSPYTPWVWAGSLGIATTAGLLKYHSGQHFPTDILAGAAIGAFIGWYIPQRHKTKKLKQESFSLVVFPTSKSMNLQVAIRF